MPPAAYAELTALMERYFDGLHRADSTILRTVFHPELAYVCATPGDELYLNLTDYMARIDAREPPAKRGEPRTGTVLDIAFAGSRLARITARMSMMGRDYTDLLTLVHDGTQWRVIAKIFAYTPKEEL